MKRIKILKQGHVTNQAELKVAEADAWLASCLEKNKFGKPERWTAEKDCTPEELAKSLGTREVDGPIGSEAKVIEHHLPAEFQVVEEDMTAEIAAAAQAKHRRNQLRGDLRSIRDANGTMTTAQLAQALRAFLELTHLEDEA